MSEPASPETSLGSEGTSGINPETAIEPKTKKILKSTVKTVAVKFV